MKVTLILFLFSLSSSTLLKAKTSSKQSLLYAQSVSYLQECSPFDYDTGLDNEIYIQLNQPIGAAPGKNVGGIVLESANYEDYGKDLVPVPLSCEIEAYNDVIKCMIMEELNENVIGPLFVAAKGRVTFKDNYGYKVFDLEAFEFPQKTVEFNLYSSQLLEKENQEKDVSIDINPASTDTFRVHFYVIDSTFPPSVLVGGKTAKCYSPKVDENDNEYLECKVDYKQYPGNKRTEAKVEIVNACGNIEDTGLTLKLYNSNMEGTSSEQTKIAEEQKKWQYDNPPNSNAYLKVSIMLYIGLLILL